MFIIVDDTEHSDCRSYLTAIEENHKGDLITAASDDRQKAIEFATREEAYDYLSPLAAEPHWKLEHYQIIDSDDELVLFYEQRGPVKGQRVCAVDGNFFMKGIISYKNRASDGTESIRHNAGVSREVDEAKTFANPAEIGAYCEILVKKDHWSVGLWQIITKREARKLNHKAYDDTMGALGF